MAMAIAIPIIIASAGMAASMTMQYVQMRKLNKMQKPVERGKNDDIRLTGSDYGAYIPRYWGKVRFAPNMIYSTKVREVRHETQQSGGGKGGPKPPKQVDYTYYTTVQLLLAANQSQSVNKVWAGNDLIFNQTPSDNSYYYEAENAFLAGGAEVVADAFCSRGHKVTGLGNGGTVTFELPLPRPPRTGGAIPTGYTILSVYYKSPTPRTLQVTPDADTPISVALPATGNPPQVETVYIESHPLTITLDNAGGDAPDIDRISVWYSYLEEMSGEIPTTGIEDPLILFPEDPYNQYAAFNYYPETTAGTQSFNAGGHSVRVYLGTNSQNPDSAIIADLDRRYGAGNGVDYASAHRGHTYIILENLKLENGNVPNFLIEADEGSRSAADIVLDLYNEKGVENVDVSAIEDKYIEGYICNSLTSPKKIIEDLEKWHGFKMIEIDGGHRAVLNDGDSVMTVPYTDLRAYTDGDAMPEFDLKITETGEEDLPRTVYIGYLDPMLEGKNNTQQSDLFASTIAKDIVEMNFPITASEPEAKGVSDRILLETHSRSKKFEGYLPPKYSMLSAGDHIIFELQSASFKVQLTKVQKSIGGTIRIQAESVDSILINADTTYSSNVSDILPDTVKASSSATNAFIFESAPVELQHSGLGIYVAACGQGFGRWQGGTIYHKLNDFEDYIPLTDVTVPCGIGVAQNSLGGHTTGEDTVNEPTIFFYEDVELESVDAEELDGRLTRNLIRIGSEWVQFRTAEAEELDPESHYKSAWKISNLRRGLLGTNAAIGNHFDNEKCLIYDDRVQFVQLDGSYFRQQVEFRPITFGRTTDHGFSQYLIIQGLSVGQQTPQNVPPDPCSIMITSVPTNTVGVINVSAYPLTCRFRKIEVSLNSDMSDAVETVIDSTEFPNMLLPEVQMVVTEGLVSATQKYIAVSHSNDNIRWSNRSNILDPVFANDTGTGGSIGNAPPTLTSVSYNGTAEQVSLVFAKNGTSTDDIKVEYKKSAASSWTTASAVFDHDDVSGSFEILKEATLQNYDLRIKQIGITGYSEVKAFSTPATSSSATPPTNLTCFVTEGAFCERQVELFWTAGTGTGEYIIERQEGFMGIWQMIGTTSSTNYIDNVTGTSLRQNYSYRVSQSGVSGYTNTVNVSISQCWHEPI